MNRGAPARQGHIAGSAGVPYCRLGRRAILPARPACLLLAAQQAAQDVAERTTLLATQHAPEDAAERVVPAAATCAAEDAAQHVAETSTRGRRLRLRATGRGGRPLSELFADVCQHDRGEDRKQPLEQIAAARAATREC